MRSCFTTFLLMSVIFALVATVAYQSGVNSKIFFSFRDENDPVFQTTKVPVEEVPQLTERERLIERDAMRTQFHQEDSREKHHANPQSNQQ